MKSVVEQLSLTVRLELLSGNVVFEPARDADRRASIHHSFQPSLSNFNIRMCQRNLRQDKGRVLLKYGPQFFGRYAHREAYGDVLTIASSCRLGYRLKFILNRLLLVDVLIHERLR